MDQQLLVKNLAISRQEQYMPEKAREAKAELEAMSKSPPLVAIQYSLEDEKETYVCWGKTQLEAEKMLMKIGSLYPLKEIVYNVGIPAHIKELVAQKMSYKQFLHKVNNQEKFDLWVSHTVKWVMKIIYGQLYTHVVAQHRSSDAYKATKIELPDEQATKKTAGLFKDFMANHLPPKDIYGILLVARWENIWLLEQHAYGYTDVVPVERFVPQYDLENLLGEISLLPWISGYSDNKKEPCTRCNGVEKRMWREGYNCCRYALEFAKKNISSRDPRYKPSYTEETKMMIIRKLYAYTGDHRASYPSAMIDFDLFKHGLSWFNKETYYNLFHVRAPL